MVRKIFTASVATAALSLATAAVAGPPPGRGGGGGPSQAGIDARANAQGAMHASPMGVMNASPNSVLGGTGTTFRTMTGAATMDEESSSPFTNPATGVSQGPAHASTTAIAHANSHSVLASGAVPTTALPGLTQGLNVVNSNGTTIGTVSQIVYGSDGTIRVVTVTNTATGQTYRLSPATLTVSGTTVTTTSTVGG